MICPRCKKHEMKATHCFQSEGSGVMRRLMCPGCPCIATSHEKIVVVDPAYGQGAAAMAKRLQTKSPPASAGGLG